MLAELIALPPIAFALWLLAGAPAALGSWPARERAGVVVGAAVILGPLALSLLGLFGWLVLVAVATVLLTLFAIARRSPRLPRRLPRSLRDAGRWALPRP